MIRITKDTSNSIVVTLTEKGTATYYLFEFFDHTQRTYAYCIAKDLSPHPERYNKFTLIDTTGPTAADGEIDIRQGQHRYVIYANTSSSNIDPTGLTELESGICMVLDTEPSVESYDPTETIATYEV